MSLKRSSTRKYSTESSHHSYSIEETRAFTNYINSALSTDELLKRHLPLSVEKEDIFTHLSDGLILMRMINLAKANSLQEKNFHTKFNLNIYQKQENLSVVLAAARKLGCRLVNVGAEDICKGRPTIILGILWQILKLIIVDKVANIQKFRNRHALAPSLATATSFPSVTTSTISTKKISLELSSEQILLKWVNRRLQSQPSCDRGLMKVVKNFDKDFENPIIFCKLLNSINRLLCLEIISSDQNIVDCEDKSNLNHRLQISQDAIDNAKKLNIQLFLEPDDLLSGNSKLIMSFIAQLYEAQNNPVMMRESNCLDTMTAVTIDQESESLVCEMQSVTTARTDTEDLNSSFMSNEDYADISTKSSDEYMQQSESQKSSHLTLRNVGNLPSDLDKSVCSTLATSCCTESSYGGSDQLVDDHDNQDNDNDFCMVIPLDHLGNIINNTATATETFAVVGDDASHGGYYWRHSHDDQLLQQFSSFSQTSYLGQGSRVYVLSTNPAAVAAKVPPSQQQKSSMTNSDSRGSCEYAVMISPRVRRG